LSLDRLIGPSLDLSEHIGDPGQLLKFST